jgi:hypothetical protein
MTAVTVRLEASVYARLRAEAASRRLTVSGMLADAACDVAASLPDPPPRKPRPLRVVFEQRVRDELDDGRSVEEIADRLGVPLERVLAVAGVGVR